MERLNAEFQFDDNLARQQLDHYYRLCETECVKEILATANLPESMKLRIETRASVLIDKLRKARRTGKGVAAFMTQYNLSSAEGIALMCLAESLLRIPDKATCDKLINDKLSLGDWRRHLGKSHSTLVNAATWGLVLTGKIAETFSSDSLKYTFFKPLKNFLRRTQAPIVREALHNAMQFLGKQFVIATDINAAIKCSQSNSLQNYRFSFDMLGEAAYTKQDAEHYYNAYVKAIKALAASGSSPGPIQGPGISVKLSALHPRFSLSQIARLKKELLPKICELINLAKEANIGLTIDAEEAHTLLVNFELVKAIIEKKLLSNWQGFGIVVQAYQKRAPYLIEAMVELLRTHQQRLMIRLVKGAYWDTEIKLTQIQGLKDYPVFTRKVATDVSYLVCAKKMLVATDVIYPQFATHNALTLSTIIELANEQQVTDYEFQCLYGMGEELYNELNKESNERKPCRIYAPVGTHEDLLAYLVRRLLENGANSSFVNKIADEHISLAEMVADPEQHLADLPSKPHPKIKLPAALYLPERLNSMGVDLANPREFLSLLNEVAELKKQIFTVVPSSQAKDASEFELQYSPIDRQHVGNVSFASPTIIAKILNCAEKASKAWRVTTDQRNQCMLKMAELLQTNRAAIIALLIYEGGKTVEDAIAELREAIDYCYYYAAEMVKHFTPHMLPGPTGEQNYLSLHARGIIVCISPWNFPLAIFLGQITAALAAGNVVIAKPASQTLGIAALGINLLHKAGFPPEVVQLLPAVSGLLGEHLLSDRRIAGVIFTGSTTTAQTINQTLAKKPGPIVPFIAETGGQNAMIVDSSALPEQVTQDVIISAFRSAGQRCSALRILFIQEEIADKIINMIIGAMAELTIGHPLALATDIGPVIDQGAKQKLSSHVEKMQQNGKLLFALETPAECEKGSYFPPHLYEINNLNVLTDEVFGPILHIIRFAGNELDDVVNQINNTGFGLTLGIHSRINSTINFITEHARVGNIYVNRNMIGAVVGVQPFGGEGLSGTGPKAGGPHYLLRLAVERTISINTTAAGGNAQLLMIEEN